jgi:hypothetical protein
MTEEETKQRKSFLKLQAYVLKLEERIERLENPCSSINNEKIKESVEELVEQFKLRGHKEARSLFLCGLENFPQ